MDSLFTPEDSASNGMESHSSEPLAARMRPHSLSEIAGQKHILAEGKLLRRAIEADRFTSLIFYGHPGTGKTTVTGQVIALLVGDGQRVAISSNSHPAINNLLRKAKSTCTAAGVASEVVKCSNAKEDPLAAEGFSVVRPDQLTEEMAMVGGTTWMFCKEELADQFGLSLAFEPFGSKEPAEPQEVDDEDQDEA